MTDAAKPAEEILSDLVKKAHVQVRSSGELVTCIAGEVSAENERREEKKLAVLRRRDGFRALSERGVGRTVELTPWQVLHAIGRGLVLARQGAGRGLAEHWQSLKYCQALDRDRGGYLALSGEGRNPERYYKATQSSEIGIGFALVVAEQLLKKRYPDHVVSVIDSDIALQAGWPLKNKGQAKGKRPEALLRRPNFLLEVWRPGEPSRVFEVASKGTHGKPAQVYSQLEKGTAHLDAVHIGRYGQTPSLLIGTELAEKGGIVVHILEAPGNVLLRPGSKEPEEPNLDAKLDEGNESTLMTMHSGWDGGDLNNYGFQVKAEKFGWFSQVLARSEAAALMAFTGGGRPTAQYLTREQGKRFFDIPAYAGADSVSDAEHRICGIDFSGTDHVFRLNKTRVEAFSGLADGLYNRLQQGRLADCRREVYAMQPELEFADGDPEWGPVSVRPDGTVMAIRVLPPTV
ncbi:hypothetical protein [Streptacidiphilus sp. EB103A]|uniref:hypothetical protein n=1 Tax=Streptacidiphilus sp. EB103A TaxID=3156275 RepID=UPI003512ECE8